MGCGGWGHRERLGGHLYISTEVEFMKLGKEAPSKTWGKGWYDIWVNRVIEAKCNLDLTVLDKRQKQWSRKWVRNWSPGL